MSTCSNCGRTGNDVHKRFFRENTERMLCDNRATCHKPVCLFEEERYCSICPIKKECPNKEGAAINLMPTV